MRLCFPRLRTSLCAAIALGLTQASCAYCDRDTAADGRYEVVSDCGGSLRQGVLVIGPSPEGYEGGEYVLGHESEVCARTIVTGAEALGLPEETVSVEGDRRFSLSGMARGLELTCGSEHFGDEVILFCRVPDGTLMCVAFVQPVG